MKTFKAFTLSEMQMNETELKQKLVSFIRGLKGNRQNNVTIKQIVKQFHDTPEPLIHRALNDLVLDDKIRVFSNQLGRRSANSSYTYEVTDREQ